jgi:hypothetical protein
MPVLNRNIVFKSTKRPLFAPHKLQQKSLIFQIFSREQKSKGFLGIFLAFCMICISPLPQHFVYDANVVGRERFYCGYAGAATQENSTIISGSFVFGDLLVSLGDYILCKINRHQVKHLKE